MHPIDLDGERGGKIRIFNLLGRQERQPGEQRGEEVVVEGQQMIVVVVVVEVLEEEVEVVPMT